MPRINSTNASIGDVWTAARWNDINEDLDDLYAYGDDRLRVRRAISGTALKIDIGAGAAVVGLNYVTYAGATNISVTNTATNYVMIDNTGTIVINTTGFVATNARLATVVCSGGVVTSVNLVKPDAFGGDLGNNSPPVNVQTLSGNLTLDNSSDQFQFLNCNGSDRTITLGTTSVVEGRTFYLKNTGTSKKLIIKQSSTILITLSAHRSCIAVYDGTNWYITYEYLLGDYGTGTDGSVTISSDTNLNPATIFNYTDFTLDATKTLSVTTVNIPLIILCQGDVAINGTIGLSGKGGAGGAGRTGGSTGSGAGGSNGASILSTAFVTGGSGGAGPVNNTAGGGTGGASYHTDGGGAKMTDRNVGFLEAFKRAVACGSGGGGGGCSNNGAQGGNGGNGGGGLLMYVGGDLTLGASSVINISGTAATNGANGGGNGGGGGGGGGGGYVFIIVQGSITNSGCTFTVNGGAFGTGGTGSSFNGLVGTVGAAGSVYIYSLTTGTLVTA